MGFAHTMTKGVLEKLASWHWRTEAPVEGLAPVPTPAQTAGSRAAHPDRSARMPTLHYEKLYADLITPIDGYGW